MMILERLLTRSDDELRELLSLIAEHKNKNARWEAFKSNSLKEALERDYQINKSDFLAPNGLEALGREFVSKNRTSTEFDIGSFRELVQQQIADVKSRNSGKGTRSRGQTRETPVKRKKTKVLVMLMILASGLGYGGIKFWASKLETKEEFFRQTSDIKNDSSLTEIERAIALAEEVPALYVDSDIQNRKEELLSFWRALTGSEFLTPKERDLYVWVSGIPYENYKENMRGYEQLLALNPDNSTYREKYDKYKTLYETEKSYLDKMSAIPNEYWSCNRGYSETSRVVTSTSSESPSLNYNILTGKISVKPGKVTEYDNTITSSMDDEVFFKFCAVGARWNPRTDACPYFMECVSAVYHKKQRLKGSPTVYGFEKVAKILRDDQIDRGRLKPSVEVSRGTHAYGKPDLMLSDVKNFKDACGVVSSTYSANVVAAEIYKYVPEVPSFSVAQSLGEKAVVGYGECNCVLQNYTGINQVMSIGYCRGDQYIDY